MNSLNLQFRQTYSCGGEIAHQWLSRLLMQGKCIYIAHFSRNTVQRVSLLDKHTSWKASVQYKVNRLKSQNVAVHQNKGFIEDRGKQPFSANLQLSGGLFQIDGCCIETKSCFSLFLSENSQETCAWLWETSGSLLAIRHSVFCRPKGVFWILFSETGSPCRDLRTGVIFFH